MTTTLGTRLGTILGSDLATFTDGVPAAPSFDASKLYALSDFGAGSYYGTQTGGGEAGISTGFGLSYIVSFAALVAAFRRLGERWTGTGGGGYVWQLDASNNLDWSVILGNNTTSAYARFAMPASLVDKLLLLTVVHTGAELRFYLGPQRIGAFVPAAGYTPTNIATFLGAGNAGAAPLANGRIHAALQFRGVPTDAHVAALAFLTRNVADAPSKAAADSVLGPVRYGASGYSGTAMLRTAGSALPGVATGFWRSCYFRLDALPAAAAYFFTQSNNSNAGWQMWVGGPGALYALTFRAVSGAAAFVNAPTLQLTANDVGKLFHFVGVYDGTTLRAYVNRVELGSGTGMTGYTPVAGQTVVGAAEPGGTSPASTVTVFGAAGGEVPLSNAEVLAHFDSVTAAGRMQPIAGKTAALWDKTQYVTAGNVPASIPDSVGATPLALVGTLNASPTGAAVTHRWSLRDVLQLANVPVNDNAAAPATIPDSVTAAPVDAMAKTGTPTVRVIDPSTDGRVSYGALGFGDTNYLEAAVGIRGAATGFTLLYAVRYDAAATGSAVLASTYTATPTGYTVYANSGQVRIFRAGSGDLVLGTAAAADVGVPKLFGVTWDGTTWRAYENGVPGATNVATMLHAGSAPMRLGTYPTGTGGGTSVSSQFALAGCDSALSDAEMAAVFADWRTSGRLRLPSGKINPHVYDLTQDIAPAPQNGIPAQVLDRAGTDHLTRVGTDLRVARRVERTWSYETTPILYGARDFTLADYYETASTLGESGAASWWVALLFMVTSQATSKTRIPFSTIGVTGGTVYSGMTIRTTATNATVGLNIIDNANASRNSPLGAIGATDIGKLQLFVGVYDQPALKLRAYHKRAEVGTGTTITGYTPSTAFGARIGRDFQAVDTAASDMVVHGVSFGIGLPTLAQVHALHDEVMATERIAGIAGMTALRVDLDADARANGNVMPAALADRAGARNFTRSGAITTAPTHARAWVW